jgi:hypothetical protein
MFAVVRVLLTLLLRYAPNIIGAITIFIAGTQGTAAVVSGIEKIGTGTVNTVQDTASKLTGGLVPPSNQKSVADPRSSETATGTRDVPSPSPVEQVATGIVNPWLWLAGGLFLLFYTTATKQTRGLARDVGSGISSTRDAVRSDFDDLQSDPSAPARGKRR